MYIYISRLYYRYAVYKNYITIMYRYLIMLILFFKLLHTLLLSMFSENYIVNNFSLE